MNNTPATAILILIFIGLYFRLAAFWFIQMQIFFTYQSSQATNARRKYAQTYVTLQTVGYGVFTVKLKRFDLHALSAVLEPV
jgi:hypothetical protein